MVIKTNLDKNFWQPKTFFINDKYGLINYLYRRQLNFYKNNLSFSENQVVLDAGCGDGSLAEDLSKISKSVFVSCDISFSLALHCKNKKLNAVVADIRNLPFRNGIFDKVLCAGVLSYIPEGTEIAVSELVRVCKTGGDVVISATNAISPFFLGQTVIPQNIRSFMRSILMKSRPMSVPLKRRTPLYYLKKLKINKSKTVKICGISFIAKCASGDRILMLLAGILDRFACIFPLLLFSACFFVLAKKNDPYR